MQRYIDDAYKTFPMVEQKLRKSVILSEREGYNNKVGTLLDYGDIVVHIFHEEDRRILQSGTFMAGRKNRCA